MTDTVKSWIEERRAIHAAATERPWVANEPRELEGVVYPEKGWDPVADCGARWNAAAIVDAHNMFPAALDALQAVLELHEPINGFEGDPSHWECNVCGDDRGPKPYPCPTVRALEGVIDDE